MSLGCVIKILGIAFFAYLFAVVFFLFSDIANANISKENCDKILYDRIYYSITQRTLGTKDLPTPEDFKLRNDAIEALRALCRGQMSSYETGDRIIHFGGLDE